MDDAVSADKDGQVGSGDAARRRLDQLRKLAALTVLLDRLGGPGQSNRCRAGGGSAMSFQGWPEAAVEFFGGLERDNSKAYWAAHRRLYDEAVLAPMTELTEELAWEFGDVKLFRPYRDIRFSADKSPYRTEIGATVGSAYIRLSAAGLAAGNGMFHLAPDQLSRYRHGVADDVRGTELERVIAAMSGHGITLIRPHSLHPPPPRTPPPHPPS